MRAQSLAKPMEVSLPATEKKVQSVKKTDQLNKAAKKQPGKTQQSKLIERLRYVAFQAAVDASSNPAVRSKVIAAGKHTVDLDPGFYTEPIEIAGVKYSWAPDTRRVYKPWDESKCVGQLTMQGDLVPVNDPFETDNVVRFIESNSASDSESEQEESEQEESEQGESDQEESEQEEKEDVIAKTENKNKPENEGKQEPQQTVHGMREKNPADGRARLSEGNKDNTRAKDLWEVVRVRMLGKGSLLDQVSVSEHYFVLR